jgi:hypothetical protein
VTSDFIGVLMRTFYTDDAVRLLKGHSDISAEVFPGKCVIMALTGLSVFM